MPEFEQEDATSFKRVIVHFENQFDFDDFFSVIGQTHTNKTKSLWHPYKEARDTKSKSYDLDENDDQIDDDE